MVKKKNKSKNITIKLSKPMPFDEVMERLVKVKPKKLTPEEWEKQKQLIRELSAGAKMYPKK